MLYLSPEIDEELVKEELPEISYNVSADYGNLVIYKSEKSFSFEELICWPYRPEQFMSGGIISTYMGKKLQNRTLRSDIS
jgi:hypothetical protein